MERLLGLSYDHFVRCVILPQGDFARFLHSTAKERQDTLVDLLGIRVYREVAKSAKAEALAARSRAEIATGQLTAYGDATEAAGGPPPSGPTRCAGWPARWPLPYRRWPGRPGSWPRSRPRPAG